MKTLLEFYNPHGSDVTAQIYVLLCCMFQFYNPHGSDVTMLSTEEFVNLKTFITHTVQM